MKETTKLETIIEAALFTKAEPTSIKQLSKLLEKTELEIEEAVKSLKETLQKNSRGIRLMENHGKVMLVTVSEVSEIIKKMVKEEYDSKLGQASLEVLSVIIYKGPVSRSEIDYIRGVNSQFTLRSLLIKGLTERVPNPRDRRSFLYRTSFKLIQFLGIEKIEDLPEYKNLNEKMKKSYHEEKQNDIQKKDN